MQSKLSNTPPLAWPTHGTDTHDKDNDKAVAKDDAALRLFPAPPPPPAQHEQQRWVCTAVNIRIPERV